MGFIDAGISKRVFDDPRQAYESWLLQVEIGAVSGRLLIFAVCLAVAAIPIAISRKKRE